MKITKSRLKTIIMEEMRKINEEAPAPSWTQQYNAPGEDPDAKVYNTDANIYQPLNTGYGGDVLQGRDEEAASDRLDKSLRAQGADSAIYNYPYDAETGAPQFYASAATRPTPQGYGNYNLKQGVTQAQLDASDYRARSGGGPEQSTAQMFAGMDMSDFPEAGASNQRFASADPAVQTPVADARAKAATAAANMPDPDTFSGAGGYNYRELADGSFMFTGPNGKPGYAPKGSGAAVAIANQRAEMYGQQSRMAESRNALKNLVRMELKKSGII